VVTQRTPATSAAIHPRASENDPCAVSHRQRVGERAGLDVRDVELLAREQRLAVRQPDEDPGRAGQRARSRSP
jgi:hypothetical protein